ncbi:MAG: hypothetical protein K9J06_13330 [Flavobacteriales bacterium]|nr:hypothetical protein [Flavobacteriales bacterium]
MTLTIASAQDVMLSDSGSPSVMPLRTVRWSGVHFREREKWQLTALDSMTLIGLQPISSHLIEQLSELERIHDRDSVVSGLRKLTEAYTALQQSAQQPRIMAAMLPDEWYSRLISLAGSWRLVQLSLHFITEAERIHPSGTYGPQKNCKHP